MFRRMPVNNILDQMNNPKGDKPDMEAVRQLRRVMVEVIRQKKPFDMANWLQTNYHGQYSKMEDVPCGTASCMWGWAARDSWFQAKGLSIELDVSFAHYATPFLLDRGVKHYSADGLALMLNITGEEADSLAAVGDIELYSTKEWKEPREIQPEEVLEKLDAILAGKLFGGISVKQYLRAKYS